MATSVEKSVLSPKLVGRAEQLEALRRQLEQTHGGQANRVSKEATAYVHRDAKFVLNVHSRWEKPEDDKRCISWARKFFNATAPYVTGGVYVNFLTQDEADRIPAAYGPNYDRLIQLKGKYDPTNLFRLNQNIKPADGRPTGL